MGVKIVEHARVMDLNLKQRSKLKWEVEGDENTRFFHGYVNNRNRKITYTGSWLVESG